MIFDKLESRATNNINNWPVIYSTEQGYETTNSNLKEITYFSSLKIISESIAKCPLQVKLETKKGEVISKKHDLYERLKLRPNPYMNAIDCMKAFVALSKHNGLAGLYINRGKKNVIEGLYPVEITGITVDDAGIIKNFKKNKILYDIKSLQGEEDSCFDKDLIILRDFSLDGINAKPVREILKENFDTSLKSQKYLNSLFQNGLTNKVVVQLTSDVKNEAELKKIQAKFDRLYSNNGRTFTVPAGYSINALNLSLADAQYEQLRRLSKEDIASMMGVPLTKLGLTKENAKSEEQDNLKFLQDTLLVIFEAIEQEMDYKLLTAEERSQGYKIRFNVNVLLRTDQKTQSEVINSYVQSGVYSLNKAKDILGVEKLDKDVTTFPSGQVTLETLLQGKASYQKQKGGDEN